MHQTVRPSYPPHPPVLMWFPRRNNTPPAREDPDGGFLFQGGP